MNLHFRIEFQSYILWNKCRAVYFVVDVGNHALWIQRWLDTKSNKMTWAAGHRNISK